MQCEVVGCTNDADPRLVHIYSGKSFCLPCALQINGWNSKEDPVPIPDGLVETLKPALPAPVHPVAGLFAPRQKRLESD